MITYYDKGKLSEPYDSLFLPLIILLSILMVSKIRYNAFPKLKDRNLIEKILLFIILLFALALTIITNGEILLYILFSIVIFGILRHLFYLIRDKKNSDNNILEN